MGSYCITGKPGAGKSLYGVGIMLDEILPAKGSDGEYLNRSVVTNIPLKIPEIHAYMVKHHREWYDQVELDDLLVVIPQAEEAEFMAEFWRYRSNRDTIETTISVNARHPAISAQEYKDGVRPEWPLNGSERVVYFLDEIHKYLNARNWKNTGAVILDYISQHRHFGDDVYWLTQSPKNVDSQFRSVTQHFEFVRNLKNERFGKFKKGNGFKVSVYQTEQVHNQSPDYTRPFKFDKEVGNCYHTSIIGGAADGGKGIKALPSWLLPASFVAAGVVAIALVTFGPNIFLKKGAESVEVETDAAGLGSPNPFEAMKPSQLETEAHLIDQAKLRRAKRSVAQPAEKEIVSTFIELESMLPSDLVASLGVGSASGGSPGVGVNYKAIDSSGMVIISGEEKAVADASLIVASIDQRADVHPVTIRAAIATIDITDQEGSALSVVSSFVRNFESDRFELEALGVSTLPGLKVRAGAGAFEGALDLLAASGRFSVTSRPFMGTVNGRKVEFRSGREIPITTLQRDQVAQTTTTTFRAVELVLGVTPQLQSDGSYRLTINQENSDVIESSTDDDGNQVPSLATQSLQTVLQVKPGEVAALGGIVVDSYRDTASGLPGLVRKPIFRRLGKADRGTSRREIILLISVSKGIPKLPRNAAPVKIEAPVPSYSPRSAIDRPEGFPSRESRRGLFRKR